MLTLITRENRVLFALLAVPYPQDMNAIMRSPQLETDRSLTLQILRTLVALDYAYITRGAVATPDDGIAFYSITEEGRAYMVEEGLIAA
jgi:hypothetical protein